MSKYRIAQTVKFRKDVKTLKKRGYDLSLLQTVIDILASGEALPSKYSDHPLRGKYQGFRDCHIKSDWILVYRINEGILTLILSETGTHSDIIG
ncbi:MAG: type II toxin-antitoxin system YafQ family toxin [Synergistaceae bacterium]|nr:type II toxin-antitoxin system YafQ family toxin [Synergistaceae bacterium]